MILVSTRKKCFLAVCPSEVGMKWKRAPEDLKENFGKIVPESPKVVKKQMFGYPIAVVNGNMFMGLHQDYLVLRLGEEERSQFLQKFDARIFEPFPGKTMKEYVVVPGELWSNTRLLKNWSQKALDFASGLKAKKPKAKKP